MTNETNEVYFINIERATECLLEYLKMGNALESGVIADIIDELREQMYFMILEENKNNADALKKADIEMINGSVKNGK